MNIYYEDTSCIARDVVVEIEAESLDEAWDYLKQEFDNIKYFDVVELDPPTEDYCGIWEFRKEI